MEHPPKQGLKPPHLYNVPYHRFGVLMEHPPKQGLKRLAATRVLVSLICFNGTSTKTRIETENGIVYNWFGESFNGTSTKTRIETFECLLIV